ncbi:MAG: UDP-N-acetylmuramoyl-L-alanyl-D-glutamate--2,6-diaminopimelate ligase [Rikenellaceae bacterium]
MKNIVQLLENVKVDSITGAYKGDIQKLTFDSRDVEKGSMFFAVSGNSQDGHQYITKAVESGAVAVVCEHLPESLSEDVCYIKVENTEQTLGHLASVFYDKPSEKLTLVGVTGTNGKTTTATLLYELYKKLGYKVGLISTVIYCIDDKKIDSTHTTPDAIRLNKMLADMVAQGCDYCFMEVSSHSIVQRRIGSLKFAGGVFSNITHDHLDYHKTFAEYIKAKKMFFDLLPKDAFALTNIDDRNGEVMVQNTKARVKTYSLKSLSDYNCKILEMHFSGMLLKMDNKELWVRFLGRFNAYNLLSVYGVAMLLGADCDEVLQALTSLGSVRGRFEYITSKSGLTAIVDYAHTPDALKNVIDTINEIRSVGQKLYVVVGCGGNRDATKRPIMGAMAASMSDLAILTSDNPRFENPDDILAQMREGVDKKYKHLVITDRREAIKTALIMADKTDIVLVAGKGHEPYQDVQGVKHHFDDKEEIEKIFDNL